MVLHALTAEYWKDPSEWKACQLYCMAFLGENCEMNETWTLEQG